MKNKPPLGIKPRWLHEEHRAIEIIEALDRYVKHGDTIIPDDWTTELNSLIDSINDHRERKPNILDYER